MHQIKKYIIQEGQIIPKHIEGMFKECLEYNDVQVVNGNLYSQFTGFIVLKDKMLISFPKHYFDPNLILNGKFKGTDSDINEHLNILFRTIKKATLKKSERGIGINKDVNSHYPFESFFRIYNYYKSYGLYTTEVERHKFGYNGKINWKSTIEKSSMVINNNNLVYLPTVVTKKFQEHVFLTKCMAFVIDSTIDKFSIFLKLDRTGYEFLDINFEKRDLIINKLREIEDRLFKDKHKYLVRNLIVFFNNQNYSSNQIQIKLHVFNLIWEDMVENYLNKYFSHIEEVDGTQKLIFSHTVNKKKYDFHKSYIYPDYREKNGYHLEPDHYSNFEGNLYLFDSKYYNEVKGLDYKQVAYFYLLSSRKEFKNTTKIYSALIIPMNKNIPMINDNEHFVYNKNFKIEKTSYTDFIKERERGFLIMESYLDIQQVMKVY